MRTQGNAYTREAVYKLMLSDAISERQSTVNIRFAGLEREQGLHPGSKASRRIERLLGREGDSQFL